MNAGEASRGAIVAFPDLVTVADLIKRDTGEVISLRAFQRQKASHEAMQSRLRRIARVIQNNNEQVVSPVSNKLCWVGLLSGEVTEIVRVPRRNLFPWVASASRKDTLNAFRYYLLRNPGCRHLVVTCGQRVGVEEVPQMLRKISDQIRRLRDRAWFSKVGEVVMRSAEFSCHEGRYHCHLHLVIRPLTKMKDADWIELSGAVGAALGTVVLDDKPVGDAYGAGSYLFKGVDVADIDPFDMGRLYDLMKHARTHEPQGSFRRMCGELRRQKMKIVWSGKALVKMERSDGSSRTAQKVDQISETADDDDSISIPDQKTEPPVNRLLRISRPVAHAMRIKEPCLLFLNFDGNLDAFLQANPMFAQFRAQLMPQWLAGLKAINQPLPIVHSIVQISACLNEQDQPDSEYQGLLNEVDSAGDPCDSAGLHWLGLDPADFMRQVMRPPKSAAWTEGDTDFPL